MRQTYLCVCGGGNSAKLDKFNEHKYNSRDFRHYPQKTHLREWYMIVNVNRLVKGDSISVCFSETVMLPAEYGLSDLQVPLHIEGRIINTGNTMEFNACMTAALRFECDKCLMYCGYPLKVDLTEVFAKKKPDYESDSADIELWMYDGDIIDIKPAVMSNLLLGIPMRMLCKEDCKGLCKICGHNLNDGDCGCDRSVLDPRLEVLRSQLGNFKSDNISDNV